VKKRLLKISLATAMVSVLTAQPEYAGATAAYTLPYKGSVCISVGCVTAVRGDITGGQVNAVHDIDLHYCILLGGCAWDNGPDATITSSGLSFAFRSGCNNSKYRHSYPAEGLNSSRSITC
jgi:hypothetical protein